MAQCVENEMQALLGKMNEHEAAFKQRAELYSDYLVLTGDPEDALDKFRNDLLKHLAGSIVVKDHKVRYQKEQFDRFIASMRHINLKTKDMSLGSFAKEYATLMEVMISTSHGDKCHKIEANYDDYGEKTVRPLNATIFYYFFSANRAGKTWA